MVPIPIQGDVLLNKTYYQSLWDKYKSIQTLRSTFIDNFSSLTLRIIIERVLRNQPVHINCPNLDHDLFEIAKQLFIELSNEIFCHWVDYPTFIVGDKVKSKKRYGIEKPKSLIFEIQEIWDKNYGLDCIDPKYEKMRMKKSYEDLIEEFNPVTQSVRDKTLKRFYTFFDVLNGKQVHDFTPTDFTKKCIFITHKQFWDELDVKTNIPTIYLPSHREESDLDGIKSIQALSDCIMYVTPKYEVCYQQILKKGQKTHTIVIYDTEEDQIQQILQDKQQFGFNVIILTNSLDPVRSDQVPCWNWFKEEIVIINSL